LHLFEDFLFEAVAFGWGVLRTASGLIRNNAVKASSVDSALRDTGSALFPCFSGFCVASCAVPSAGGHTLPHILMADVCCGSKTDVARPNRDVRFTPESGHSLARRFGNFGSAWLE
jgi:hypothetical protein